MHLLLWVLRLMCFSMKYKPRDIVRREAYVKKANRRLRQVIATSRFADEIKALGYIGGYDNSMTIDTFTLLIEKRANDREKTRRGLKSLMKRIHQDKTQERKDVSLVIRTQEVLVGGLNALVTAIQFIKTISKGDMGDGEEANTLI